MNQQEAPGGSGVSRLFDLRGKTALVTGAGQGIGRALAKGLAESGVSVAVNDIDAVRARTTAEQLLQSSPKGSGVRTLDAVFDVTDPEAVEAGVAQVEESLGPLDILVNNAGMQHRAPLHEFPLDRWRKLVELNLSAAFLVGAAVARRMLQRRGGKIVNVGSLQCEVVRPGIAPYAATKGGIKMLTKGMAADWAPYNIQVNGIGPGYIETDLTAPLRADPDFDRWVRSRTPAGRWGQVEDLVGTVLFLASPASDFVQGQMIYVDGGMLCVL